jgi:GTP-binding protein EngB required for normal cell division
MPEPQDSATEAAAGSTDQALSLARTVVGRFDLTDLLPLLRAAEISVEKQELNLAVFGRFKAGKSSFLNQLIGRAVLPVGVTPVTSIVTEISSGLEERAVVSFKNNEVPRIIPIGEVASYVTESENPENRKGVLIVSVTLPLDQRFDTLKLVDTPGLETVFAHSTEASLSWSPRVDLALVAVAVDPPLTQHDVALIERLQRFTPNVCVLLTKVDTIDATDQKEVLAYVDSQIQARVKGGVPVLPYSTRPGYEALRLRFEREYLSKALTSFRLARSAALTRKLQTLLLSAADYLRLSLKSAEAEQSDREQLRTQVLGSERAIADQRLRFQLIADHAGARTRSVIEGHLRNKSLATLRNRLAERLAVEQCSWHGSFARTLAQFEQWLRAELAVEISNISIAESEAFLEPVRDVQRLYQRELQGLRDSLAQKVQHVFGVPLRTTEPEMEWHPPRRLDISIGKIFDHNWELISALIPMRLFRDAVERRLAGRVEYEVFKNLSRLTSQWEESILCAIRAARDDVQNRFEALILTVRRLLAMEEPEQRACVSAFLQRILVVLESLSTHSQERDSLNPK